MPKIAGSDGSAPKTMSDFFTLRRGTTYKSRLLGDPGPVLLGLATIQRNGGFRSGSLKTYGGDCPEDLLVQPGELYASLKDVTQAADLLGAAAMLPPHYGAGRLTQDTVKLVPTCNTIPLNYIYWILRTPECRDYCRSHATGTTNLGLSRADFLAFPVPPAAPSRLRLAEVLTAIEKRIELHRRTNATLEAMARALFRSWFVDFDPVRAKMEGCDTGLPRVIADLFPNRLVDSELGQIPDGWRSGTLADIASLNTESWRTGDPPQSVAYVDLSNTKWGYIERVETHAWEEAPSRARRVLRKGDTIVATVRPGNGSFALIDEDGLTGSTGFAALRPRKVHDRELVWCAVTSPNNISRLAYLADGGAYPAVRPDAVLATPITLAGCSARKAFASSIAALFDRIETNKRASRALAALRDVLLPRLVSGELQMFAANRPRGDRSDG